MVFKQIVVLDDINIFDNFLSALKTYSKSKVKLFGSDPQNIGEIIGRINGADCVLLSWRTSINKEILDECENIKFIGLCGPSSGFIDLEECRKRNIVVSNVVDYGDEGVVEYILYELINLVRGLGQYRWKDYPAEINKKTLGIIGLGAVGKLLATSALGFKMRVLYNSKTRNPEWEKRGLIFTNKKELLTESDFISLQTPKDVKILDKDDFELMSEKILVNTTLGKAFEEKHFKDWIKKPNNYAIMDASTSKEFYDEFHNLDRVVFSDFIAGRTKESILRLSQKVLGNITAFLAGNPINKIN